MFQHVLRLLSRKKHLSILIYHQVLAEYDPMRPYEVTAEVFEQHLQHLSSHFTVLTLKEAVTRMAQGTLPSNAAVITFDDGYENNASVALPLLKKYGCQATFFIASDFLNGGAMWNDKVVEYVRQYPHLSLTLDGNDNKTFDLSNDEKRCQSASDLLMHFKYLPFAERLEAVDEFVGIEVSYPNLMMTDAQVLALHQAGMEIGGHTCGHPILAKLTDDEAYLQIKNNKDYLEALLNTPLATFAYPNGRPNSDYRLSIVEQVKKAGYQCAVSTSYGVSNVTSDFYQLPRFTPWRNDKNGFLGLLAKNYFNKAQLASV